MSTADFSRWVRRRVEERAPAAAVRFGDAEARLLVADSGDGRAMEDAIGKLTLETGLSFAPRAVLEIKELVALAFERADVLGIRAGERTTDARRMWMAKLGALYCESLAAGRRRATLAHCLFSHDILSELPALLAGRCVSAITCRDVKAVLEREWGLNEVNVYQVPSQHLVRDIDGPYEAAMHEIPIWPDAHARVRSELTVREPGEVFLVGAGVFGKDLCIRVRELGGIALDMGSAMDRIAGKKTRGPERRVLNLYARGKSAPEIVERLEDVFGVPVEQAEVERVLEKAAAEGRLAAVRSRWKAGGERPYYDSSAPPGRRAR